MREPNDESVERRLRVGSLFSGYDGLDLAVEEVFDARTAWFSEISEPVARVFAHHWPDAPNLGDITAIDWSTVESVDILCGGFPCQDVSMVGKRRPRTWRPQSRRCNPSGSSSKTSAGCSPHPAAVQPRTETAMNDTTPTSQPGSQPPTMQPFAIWNPTRWVWKTSQLDLYGDLVPCSETWPTSGMTHDGSAYPLPPWVHRISGSAFSSSPVVLFRTPLASDSVRGGETLPHVKTRRGTIALSHQVIDLVIGAVIALRRRRWR